MTLENPARRRPVETDLLRKSLRDSRRTWKTLRVSHSSHRPHDDDQVLIHHSGGRYCAGSCQVTVNKALNTILRARGKSPIGSAGRQRPDLADLTTQTLWEIKPSHRLATAQAEVLGYSALLNAQDPGWGPGPGYSPPRVLFVAGDIVLVVGPREGGIGYFRFRKEWLIMFVIAAAIATIAVVALNLSLRAHPALALAP